MLYPLSYGGIMGLDFTPDPRYSPVSKILLAILFLAGAGVLLVRWAGRGDAPAAGSAAPDFALPDAQGQVQRLADYRGRWLVLYFYPKDETPGCTAEACSLRDAFAGFGERNAALLGVSLDSVTSHAAFAQHHRLPFPLLADADGRVARAYGSLWDFGLVRFAKRHTFLIDPEGRIARVYRDVSPQSHARTLLDALDQFRLEARPGGTNNPDMDLR